MDLEQYSVVVNHNNVTVGVRETEGEWNPHLFTQKILAVYISMPAGS